MTYEARDDEQAAELAAEDRPAARMDRPGRVAHPDIPVARRILAAAASAPPAIAIAVTAMLWWDALRDGIAFHWDAAGRVDGVIQAPALYGIAQAISAAAGLVAVVAALRPATSRRMLRDVLTWAGFFAGAAMTLWLVPAGLTAAAGGPHDARLHGWLALLAAFLLYGLAVRMLVPTTDQEAAAAAG